MTTSSFVVEIHLDRSDAAEALFHQANSGNDCSGRGRIFLTDISWFAMAQSHRKSDFRSLADSVPN